MSNGSKEYWNNRYLNHETGWDIGYISTPLKEYFDQIEDIDKKILIPGGGNSYEAEYLHNKGFKNVFVIDIAPLPLDNLKKRIPDFPTHHLLLGDFFDLQHREYFDLIIEQTFFCAIHPSLRKEYAKKCHSLLNKTGKICGLLFDAPLNTDRPPYGGNKKEYTGYFKDLYQFTVFDKANNSIPPRSGRELFIILEKI